jgi:Ca-activated chloride channel family protein
VLKTYVVAGVVAVWLAGVLLPMLVGAREGPSVTVVHWANGHMMSDALLPAFAKEFNAGNFRTSSGNRIKVEPVLVNSGVIKDQLIHRVARTNPSVAVDHCEAVGCGGDQRLADPTIVTPVADHWLTTVNYAVGRTVVDTTAVQGIANTWIGIATYRGMAECLGWPNQEIGFADVVALRNDPRGWESCPTARTEWGRRPLVSFTDPYSSSTGRSVLIALYSIAAEKPVDSLSEADVASAEVAEYVRQFQRTVDHYVPDTLILNSKIFQGPRYGHFFFIGEDNLVKLYQGKETVALAGEKKPRRLEQEMVMIYPKEGAIPHRYPAAVVNASWVTPEQGEAAQQWIAYLREEPRQRAFMEEGFRPATGIPLSDPISPAFGLDPNKPVVVRDANAVSPETAEMIVKHWTDVKNPGVVTFVVDVSGSMSGEKLAQAKQGVRRAVDRINDGNFVGLVTFSDSIHERVETGLKRETRYAIDDAVERAKPMGGTHLYSALLEGIRMADSAPADPDAVRGVVVLTDGKANGGQPLHSVIRLMSTGEQPVPSCTGFESEGGCRDAGGASFRKQELIGGGLAVQTRHPIHIFYVGIGKDADLEVGRMLAEATGAAYQGTTEKSLSAVIETFGAYF